MVKQRSFDTGRISEIFYKYRALIGIGEVVVGFLTAALDPWARITAAGVLLGSLLALIGFVLRFWASAYNWVNIAEQSPQAQGGLITQGPYAVTRNPIYLGAIFMVAALNLGIGSPLAVLTMLVPTILTHLWQIEYEGHYLRLKFGEAYDQYKHQVPALVPLPGRTYQGIGSSLRPDLKCAIRYDAGPLLTSALFGLLLISLYLTIGFLTLPWIVALFGLSAFGGGMAAVLGRAWIK